MADRPAIHCITYGDPGGGKSTFATTWPRPILGFIFDAHGKDTPYMRWARANGCTVTDSVDSWGLPVKEIINAAGEIEMRLEYYNDISPMLGEDRVGYPHTWELFEWRMRERAFFNEGWQTVLVDSVTFMELCARMYAKFVKNPDSKEPRQWFGYSTDALELALLVQLQAFTGNLLVLAHIHHDKDEVLQTFVRQLAAPGRLTARNELAGGYSELYRAYVVRERGGETQFVLQTQRDNLFSCATQIHAPDPCWQDWTALWENFT